MAQIGRTQTIDGMINRVGSKLDVTITDTSTPNREQVVQWLNDGSLLLARLLPLHRLGGLKFDIIISDVGETADVDRDDILRISTVKKYGVECTIRDERDLALVSTRMPLSHTTRSPVCAITGVGGSAHLQFFPTSRGEVHIKAVKRPTAYEDVEGWAPDDWSIPAELELAVVDYAVVQGKVQDEEPQQAQMLVQMWGQTVGIEVKTDAIGAD